MILIFVSGVFAGVCVAFFAPAIKYAVREVSTARRVKCWRVDFEGNAL